MLDTQAYYIPQSREELEEQFSAEMTQNQFEALRLKLDYEKILNELSSIDHLKNINPSPVYDYSKMKVWIMNGWNTEHILRESYKLFTGKTLSFSIQWAFPQLYYSNYAVTMAYFKVAGHPEKSHSSVIRKCGELIYNGNYPISISFLANGGLNDIDFINIEKDQNQPSIRLNTSDMRSINTQICQFLNSTRKIDLKNKKSQIKIKRKDGKGNKKNFNSDDWRIVSKKLGYTNILSLIYRKRLKSNYRDIDTYLSDHIEPENLYESIIHIVEIINLIHEMFICRSIGDESYCKLIDELQYSFIKNRYNEICKI